MQLLRDAATTGAQRQRGAIGDGALDALDPLVAATLVVADLPDNLADVDELVADRRLARVGAAVAARSPGVSLARDKGVERRLAEDVVLPLRRAVGHQVHLVGRHLVQHHARPDAGGLRVGVIDHAGLVSSTLRTDQTDVVADPQVAPGELAHPVL
eukprot:1400062-Prymnesium_polylepis.2